MVLTSLGIAVLEGKWVLLGCLTLQPCLPGNFLWVYCWACSDPVLPPLCSVLGPAPQWVLLVLPLWFQPLAVGQVPLWWLVVVLQKIALAWCQVSHLPAPCAVLLHLPVAGYPSGPAVPTYSAMFCWCIVLVLSYCFLLAAHVVLPLGALSLAGLAALTPAAHVGLALALVASVGLAALAAAAHVGLALPSAGLAV